MQNFCHIIFFFYKPHHIAHFHDRHSKSQHTCTHKRLYIHRLLMESLLHSILTCGSVCAVYTTQYMRFHCISLHATCTRTCTHTHTSSPALHLNLSRESLYADVDNLTDMPDSTAPSHMNCTTAGAGVLGPSATSNLAWREVLAGRTPCLIHIRMCTCMVCKELHVRTI